MIIKDKTFDDERALFFGQDLEIEGCTFQVGESPLKHSSDVKLKNCAFKWKYPLWFSKNATLENCVLFETARSGVWYTENIAFLGCEIVAPKTFRRTKNVTLKNVNMPNAAETLWSCDGVTLENVKAAGDYFGMNAKNVNAYSLALDGNYCFDGGENIWVEKSCLNSKDSFWNCKNVFVQDTTIIGEYIGWNSENVTFKNCTIESLQGFCYIKNLNLINCVLKNTTLAFEYSSVDAEIDYCDSILNPSEGVIVTGDVGELIMEPSRVDVTKTRIIIKKK